MKNNLYIVLGHRLYENTKVSTILKKRLNKSIDLAKKNDIILVAGGNPAKQKHTEAYMMKKYILDNSNHNSDNIIMENKSNTTIENFKYIHAILQKMNIKTIDRMYIITSTFHMPKAKRISKNYTYQFSFIKV